MAHDSNENLYILITYQYFFLKFYTMYLVHLLHFLEGSLLSPIKGHLQFALPNSSYSHTAWDPHDPHGSARIHNLSTFESNGREIYMMMGNNIISEMVSINYVYSLFNTSVILASTWDAQYRVASTSLLNWIWMVAELFMALSSFLFSLQGYHSQLPVAGGEQRP